MVFCSLAGATAHADNADLKLSQWLSGTGNIGYLAAGVLLPLAEDGQAGKQHTLRTADAMGTSVVFAEAIKMVTRVKRPDGNGHDSFPSGHATAAFAIATMESHYHPSQTPLWYGGATLIGYSRVRLRRHRVDEVLVGALLGTATARWELTRPHGLILTPLIEPETGATGLQLSRRF